MTLHSIILRALNKNMRTKRTWPYFFGSELADSGVRAVNAYGWGVRFVKGSLQSLAVSFFGIMHLGSRIRNRILTEILNRENCSRKSLLDAGCGIGQETVHLAPNFKSVLGVDIDKEKITEAKKLARKSLVKNVKFETLDLTEGRLGNRMFDVIISFEVIEHVSSGKKFISALDRSLKSGGKLIISFPSRTLLSKIAQKSLKHFEIGYNPEDIKVLLKDTNLRIEKKYSYGKSILGKLVIAADFVFKKTIPILSVVFFPLFYPLLILDLRLPWFGTPRGFILVLGKK